MYALKRYGLLIAIQLWGLLCAAQNNWVTDSLNKLNERIRNAKQAGDKSGVLQSYFDNTFITGFSSTSNEDFHNVTDFLEQGISYAKAENEFGYAAAGHTKLAAILRKRNEFEKAEENANKAIQYAEKSGSDSIRAVANIELGDCYQKKNEIVEASKCFTIALDLVLGSKNHGLESNINRRLSNLYYLAGDTTEAVRQLYKSVVIDREFDSGEGLIEDYTLLGRVTNNSKYIDTVFLLADKYKLRDKVFRAKQILLAIYGFVDKDPQKAVAYINAQSDLKNYLMKAGISNYYWYVGQLFRYGNMPDSGLYYLQKAEPQLINEIGYSTGVYIYMDLAVCYQLKQNRSRAVYYYEKILDHFKEVNDQEQVAVISDSLSSLYTLEKEYKKALEYKLAAISVKDIMETKAKEKELVLLDLEREAKKHEEELHEKELALEKKHRLQFLGITIGLSIVFFCLLVIGMFPVSKIVIKILGFISFISLFEFIILLIEHKVLHPITHGDPLKLWLIKIVLIAMLVPVQEFLEHKFIHFLQSKKLYHVRIKMTATGRKAKKKQGPEDPDSSAGINLEEGLL